AAMVVRTGTDSCRLLAFDLAAIVVYVVLSGFWIFREAVRRRRKRRAIIAWGRDGNRELTQSCFFHQRRARVNFFMDRSVLNTFWWDRLPLSLIPTIDDLFGFTLQTKAIDLPRGGQGADHHRDFVLPALHVGQIVD